jgi:hypothetical protein
MVLHLNHSGLQQNSSRLRKTRLCTSKVEASAWRADCRGSFNPNIRPDGTLSIRSVHRALLSGGVSPSDLFIDEGSLDQWRMFERESLSTDSRDGFGPQQVPACFIKTRIPNAATVRTPSSFVRLLDVSIAGPP